MLSLDLLRPSTPPRVDAREQPVLHPASSFRAILSVERMRADRTGTAIALLVLELCPPDAVHEPELVEIVRNSVRATDYVGMIETGRLAIILWDTPAGGAEVYRAKLRQQIPADWRVSISLYLHPRPGGSDVVEDEPQLPIESRLPSPSRDTQESTPLPLELITAQPLPWWKRAVDIAGSAFGLLLLSPLLILTAAAIKATSPGPVFFSQWRSGLGGRPFRMHKFRSMVVDAEDRQKELREQNQQDGPAFKLDDDPRITPIGRLIRKTSIDELPQLWNVLLGEMSLVGPRPLPLHETDGCLNWQRRRLEVTPGLTCIWQVQDRRTTIPFAEWARMDIAYLRGRTLRTDLRLIMMTFSAIFGRKGV